MEREGNDGETRLETINFSTNEDKLIAATNHSNNIDGDILKAFLRNNGLREAKIHAILAASQLTSARVIRWFYLMRANKKEKDERAIIEVLGDLYTFFDKKNSFFFGAI